MDTKSKYKFKGTPGPWVWEYMGGETLYISHFKPEKDETGDVICTIQYSGYKGNEYQGVEFSNARLIALSPEMLQELITVNRWLGNMTLRSEMGDKIYLSTKKLIHKSLNIQQP